MRAARPLLPAWLGLQVLTATILLAGEVHTIVDDAWSGATGCHFSGRLLEAHAAPGANHGSARTFYRNSRQLLADGEPGLVTWRVADLSWSLRTDAEGYWSLDTNQATPLPPGWHEITADPAAASSAGLLVANPANHFGIISDIDDTILVSDVPHKRALLKNSLAVPPENRAPVPGMAALYLRLLQQNPAPDASAVFYLSASPKQLTENVRAFLRHQGFPRGVLHLKEVSDASGRSLLDHHHDDYKVRAIEAVLLAFPKTRFALFGDDGEQDPEIYAAIRERFPDRIEGVWIHRVNPDPTRARFPEQADIIDLLPAR